MNNYKGFDFDDWMEFYSKGNTYSYSKAEILSIYELARFSLENGDIHRAEILFLGLTNIVPDFVPAWLGLTYVYIQQGSDEDALNAAKMAYRYAPERIEAILFYASCLLSCGDLNTAGMYLGEVADKVGNGISLSPNVSRFFYFQMARYQALAEEG